MQGELSHEHQALLDAAENLRVAVKHRSRIVLSELVRLRARVSGPFKDHRQLEEALVFTPALQRGGIIGQPSVRAILRHIQEQKSCCYDNDRRWTVEAIQSDWDGYSVSVEQSVPLLNKLIRFEEEVFFPHLRRLVAAWICDRSFAAIGRILQDFSSRQLT